MDVDDEDSFVVPAELEGWDPMDLAPKPGETAHQAARRMELKGRRHTNYVAKWGDPDSLTAIMNRASNRNTTVEFMSSPVPGAASTAPPTAEEATNSAPSYSAPTPKVHYDAGGSGFNAGRDSLPLAPSGVPSKAPPGSARPKGPPVGPVFKPPLVAAAAGAYCSGYKAGSAANPSRGTAPADGAADQGTRSRCQ